MTEPGRSIALGDLAAAQGSRFGPTGWHTVVPRQVADYVAATGQPAADGDVPPLMLLALTNRFLPQLITVTAASSGVNYGTGQVRFPAPVPAGSRLRATAELVAVEAVAGGAQATVRVTQQVEGRAVPACVADTISRYLR